MLRPIPSKIMTHSATLRQCTGVDEWETPSWSEMQLERICIQPMHATVLTKDNTETSLTSVAFVDARISTPEGFDFQAAQDASEEAGRPLTLVYNGRIYTVLTIDALCDDRGQYHHAELGLK